MKHLIRFLVRLVIFLGVVSIGIWAYFHYVFHMPQRIQTAVQGRVQQHNIHLLSYTQIPIGYREAVIATEDRRFAWDPGIDVVGIVRSISVDVQKDGYLEGGSTITQQLVDNTLIQHGKSLTYKVKQVLYAVGIYATLSKQETFADYANLIYFGQGAYGLYNASEVYFRKTPGELNEGELAMLAGLPNAPSVYDPMRNLTLAKQRQKVVVDNMFDAGIVTSAQAATILQEPIRLSHS